MPDQRGTLTRHLRAPHPILLPTHGYHYTPRPDGTWCRAVAISLMHVALTDYTEPRKRGALQPSDLHHPRPAGGARRLAEATPAAIKDVQDRLLAIDGVAYADPDYVAHPGQKDIK